ncbi:MAG: hypothetical protein K9L84_05510 [Candidatus Omnitrophica bacterium]|nr:hypothetical protein [Candidatus Omnitrophota bacterium]
MAVRRNKEKVLVVVYKATSELDFIIPFIWKLRNNLSKVDISILYCVLDKKMILRKSLFYTKELAKMNVTEYDYSDFIIKPLAFLEPLIRKLFFFSFWDFTSLHFGFSQRGRIRKKTFQFFVIFQRKMLRIMEKILNKIISFKTMLRCLKPDIIFFPLRNYVFYGKDKIYKYTYENDVKVVLYPHSPFPSSGRYSLHYGYREWNKGEVIPEFCCYWSSLREELTFDNYPQLQDRNFYAGYPGNDLEWFDYLKSDYNRLLNNDDGEKQLKCLFIARRFVLDEPNDGSYDYMYLEEVLDILTSLADCFKKLNLNIELVIKPHPQNDFNSIKKMMNCIDCSNWSITYQPIYQELVKNDFFVSVPSGITLIPALYGKPVILINCSVKKLFERWSVTKKIFSGAQFYVDELSQLEDVVGKVIDCVERDTDCVRKEKEHYRGYFPDGSLGNCLNEFKKLMG